MDECAQNESGPVEESRAGRISRGLLGPSRLARSFFEAALYRKTAALRSRVGRRFNLHACVRPERARMARLAWPTRLVKCVGKSRCLAIDFEKRRQPHR